MSLRLKVFLAVLIVGVVLGALTLPSLHRNVERMAQPARTEEQARREVVQPPLTTPADVNVKARMFWASPVPGALQAFTIEMPLASDPVVRSKQLINALITQPPAPAQRTLPSDLTLLEFYLLPDGTAIADFSDSLATETPSGILSEQMAVDSIVRTLDANVGAIQRLKILIHGQEVDTLAGHLDLTGMFPVQATPAASLAPDAAPIAAGQPPRLTPPAATVKLSRE